ncbi:MAG: 50S ribosomal protein L18 [Nitrospinae bacterium]|nr:50S ribosomal protein L18 [Nitrospinota bacterium]
MKNLERKRNLSVKRKKSIRKKISGTAERPRLTVYRSLNHIYGQLINDEEGKTLVAGSSKIASLKLKGGGNKDAAEKVGKYIGEEIKKAGIEKIVFDRNGNAYHGRVKALAEGIRSSGINF